MIKEYVLSIISISITGLLIDVLLPDGNIRKYSNFAISIILSVILIQPITNLFDKEFDFEFEKTNYEIDYTKAVEATVKGISGFEDSEVDVVQDENKIESIIIYTNNEKILEKAEEELKKEYVKKILSTIYGVENIIFSE